MPHLGNIKNKLSIAAVIVTYNRIDLLLECLEALKNQTYALKAIYLIDNASTDDTYEKLIEKKYIEKSSITQKKGIINGENYVHSISSKKIKITYKRLEINIGGAGGFYEGLKLALDDRHDWIWVMDDDAIPENIALNELVKFLTDNRPGLTSTVININGNIDISHRKLIKKYLGLIKFMPINENEYEQEFFESDIASYVGFLINAKFLQLAGLPIRNFFIFYDDTEHSLRLNKFGRFLNINSSRIYHKAPVQNQNRMSDNWKIYFQYRNRLITYKLHFSLLNFSIIYFSVISRLTISVLLLKKEYSRMLFKAIKDWKFVVKNIK